MGWWKRKGWGQFWGERLRDCSFLEVPELCRFFRRGESIVVYLFFVNCNPDVGDIHGFVAIFVWSVWVVRVFNFVRRESWVTSVCIKIVFNSCSINLSILLQNKVKLLIEAIVWECMIPWLLLSVRLWFVGVNLDIVFQYVAMGEWKSVISVLVALWEGKELISMHWISEWWGQKKRSRCNEKIIIWSSDRRSISRKVSRKFFMHIQSNS